MPRFYKLLIETLKKAADGGDAVGAYHVGLGGLCKVDSVTVPFKLKLGSKYKVHLEAFNLTYSKLERDELLDNGPTAPLEKPPMGTPVAGFHKS